MWLAHVQQERTAMPQGLSTTTTALSVTRATTAPPLLVVSPRAFAGEVTTVQVAPRPHASTSLSQVSV